MNTTNRILTVVVSALLSVSAHPKVDYDNDSVYLSLRNAMHESFNNADESRFDEDIKKLEDYLLHQGDMHGYYTQRCNEIVFMMNGQKIVEAYKAARRLSQELRDKKLDKEMYMAYNMLGHIYRYCGNEEEAKRNFRNVLEMMEKAGYPESMPPIYMNIVGVYEKDNPEEALRLIDKALAIAHKHSPERVFDIETRRTLIYFSTGEKEKFFEGYNDYKRGEAEGLTSVHGRSLEVFYQAMLGHTDKAVALAKEELGEESYSTIATIYKNAGRWQEAYDALEKETQMNDSINSIILTNSVEGLSSELTIYEMERKTARIRTITLTIIIVLLLSLIGAQIYIFWSRRRHMQELKKAYERALESDKMKTAFIQNMSHEMRTPLNIISGFAQVIADPELSVSQQERLDIAHRMLTNTRIITRQIDEMLELSLNESKSSIALEDGVDIVDLLSNLLQEVESLLSTDVRLVFENKLPTGFTMRTNRSMVHRMVDILLDNAVKYTSEGAVILRARIEEDNLVIAVEDTGCGIPASETSRIFERFVKLDTFKEGLGLGLPLCRVLATRLRGTLVYDESHQGRGSRFVLSLPI